MLGGAPFFLFYWTMFILINHLHARLSLGYTGSSELFIFVYYIIPYFEILYYYTFDTFRYIHIAIENPSNHVNDFSDTVHVRWAPDLFYLLNKENHPLYTYNNVLSRSFNNVFPHSVWWSIFYETGFNLLSDILRYFIWYFQNEFCNVKVSYMAMFYNNKFKFIIYYFIFNFIYHILIYQKGTVIPSYSFWYTPAYIILY